MQEIPVPNVHNSSRCWSQCLLAPSLVNCSLMSEVLNHTSQWFVLMNNFWKGLSQLTHLLALTHILPLSHMTTACFHQGFWEERDSSSPRFACWWEPLVAVFARPSKGRMDPCRDRFQLSNVNLRKSHYGSCTFCLGLLWSHFFFQHWSSSFQIQYLQSQTCVHFKYFTF